MDDKHRSGPIELQRYSQDDVEETDIDFADMMRLGHQPVLKRNFKSLSVLGITCVLLTTWMSILSASTFSLINGGRAGTIWTFLATWICTIPVVASLAEMASMAPTAGGQYHWVSEFAPPTIQKPLSYLSGWLAALGWQTFVAGSGYATAVKLISLVSIANPDYHHETWHNTLLTIAVGIFAILFNTFGAKHLPFLEGCVLFLYFAGFIAVVVPLWSFPQRATAHEVFTDFSNLGGWSSIGAAVVLGQTATASALIGLDSAAHMAEEVKNAAKNVPRMMMLSIGINGALGFVSIVTYIFAIKDVKEEVLNSPLNYPFIGIFEAATGSTGTAIGMTAPFVALTACTCINSIMAASRQLFALARDGGLPFSNFFMTLTKVGSTPLPINAMFCSLIVLVVLALLNLGSNLIVGIIVSLLASGVGLTYSISIGCVLWRRLFGSPLPPTKWSLGRYGVAINAFAFFYQVFSTIIGFFPTTAHTTAKDMNWAVAVCGAVLLLSGISYIFHGRHVYVPPVERIRKME
ncbi:GABA-specific permease [Acrodontium crateriforme]|uniref:GABA-specific permease n=1 Tax=Acrodontium crateriforme TaxID=150365 RepID=A0AAQ3M9U1_9PEZI|nr:GABA-specific permease [Acrodontium crateriforme]